MKEIYYIESYIPSDENIVVNNIFKLISLGYKQKKYIFIGINTNHGFGTCVDDYGSETEKEAILKQIKYSGMCNNKNENNLCCLCELTFNEALLQSEIFNKELINKLK